MSSNDSCVTEVTAAISRIRTSVTAEEVQNNGDFKSEGSSNPSPAESPSPTIRYLRIHTYLYTYLFICAWSMLFINIQKYINIYCTIFTFNVRMVGNMYSMYVQYIKTLLHNL